MGDSYSLSFSLSFSVSFSLSLSLSFSLSFFFLIINKIYLRVIFRISFMRESIYCTKSSAMKVRRIHSRILWRCGDTGDRHREIGYYCYARTRKKKRHKQNHSSISRGMLYPWIYREIFLWRAFRRDKHAALEINDRRDIIDCFSSRERSRTERASTIDRS